MNGLEQYNRIFMDVLGVKEEALNESLTFKATPQWDSVVHLTLITALEDAFGIMFDAEDILHYGSYENGKTILRKMGVVI